MVRTIKTNAQTAALVAVLFVLGVAVGTWAPTLLVPRMLDGMMFSLSVTVVVVYAYGLIRYRLNMSRGPFAVRLGITLSWIVSGMLSSYRLYHSLTPGGLVPPVDWYRMTMVTLCIIAAVLHIVAVGIIDEQNGKKYFCFTLWSMVGGAATILVLGYHYTLE